jgi:tetratricopeptide (TPR) repeat protein
VSELDESWLEDYADALAASDFERARAALAEHERAARSLVEDYRSAAGQSAGLCPVFETLDALAKDELRAAFFALCSAKLEPDPITQTTRIALAHILAASDEWTLAAAMFECAGLEEELQAELLKLRLDRTLLANRISEVAIEHYEARLREAPEDAAAATDLAVHRRTLGQEDDARAACRQALSHEPGYEDAALLLAEIHAERDELTEARALLETALEAAPESAELLAALGELLESEPELALGHYDRALTQEPAHPVALEGKRRVLRELEAWDELAEHLERMCEGEDNDELSRELRSLYREHLKQPDKAHTHDKRKKRARQRAERELSEHIARAAQASRDEPARPAAGSPIWILVAVVAVLVGFALVASLRN